MKNKEITIFGLLILIKDNKTPEKITYNGEVWEFNKDTKDYRNLIGNRLFSIYKTEVILSHKVKILDEENDEFEDIEFEDLWELAPWQECTSRGDIIEAINQLIRNQKKIIERLKKDE